MKMHCLFYKKSNHYSQSYKSVMQLIQSFFFNLRMIDFVYYINIANAHFYIVFDFILESTILF